eukprot:364228-Chlamydomonas_euryale.AAC.18
MSDRGPALPPVGPWSRGAVRCERARSACTSRPLNVACEAGGLTRSAAMQRATPHMARGLVGAARQVASGVQGVERNGPLSFGTSNRACTKPVPPPYVVLSGNRT